MGWNLKDGKVFPRPREERAHFVTGEQLEWLAVAWDWMKSLWLLCRQEERVSRDMRAGDLGLWEPR